MDKLILFTPNKNKILEMKYIEKYINIENNINKIIIKFSKNINRDIIKSYKQEPDLLIIDFNENNKNYLDINKIPKYPIFVNNVIYITPINIQEINGFTNDNYDKKFRFDDFIERIFRINGGIITTKDYKYLNLEFINLKSGIKSLMFNNNINKEWFVNNIPKFMTKYIYNNKSGWFANYNKIAIDWLFNNYKINTTAELGAYYGSSTIYIAKKNINSKLYSFDMFRNVLLSDYVVSKKEPIEINYFWKYIKFNSFHKNLEDYPNIYSVKLNGYKSIKWLYNNKIKVDFIYIDFCKKDNRLIKFVDEIFNYYPNVIIIGDDVHHLNFSLKYFEKKYNFKNLISCYVCSYKTKLINTDILLKNIYNEKYKVDNTNIDELKKYNDDYKINYVIKIINAKNGIKYILNTIKILNINPNNLSFFILQGGNIFHHIACIMNNDINYYRELFKELDKIYKNNNIKNNYNLTPNDILDYGPPKFF